MAKQLRSTCNSCMTTVAGTEVMMMEMPFGANPVAVIEGGHKALRESSSGGLTDPTATGQ